MRKRILMEQSGQVLAEFAVLTLVLIVIIAFAVDFGIANANKARLTQAAQNAEAECALPAVALQVKNSDSPGKDMCRALIASLREDGYEGAVTAYYYEPTQPESGLPDTRRVYIYGVLLETDAQTLFSVGAGGMKIPISARIWQYSVAYSSTKVWHPTMLDNGYISVGAGESAEAKPITPVMSLDEATMPGGMDILKEAIQDANQRV